MTDSFDRNFFIQHFLFSKFVQKMLSLKCGIPRDGRRKYFQHNRHNNGKSIRGIQNRTNSHLSRPSQCVNEVESILKDPTNPTRLNQTV
jgi:hypothetical protein